MRESRQMPVPPGLAGMRVDAGLAKLLGLSRTVAAELAEAGDVQVDGGLALQSVDGDDLGDLIDRGDRQDRRRQQAPLRAQGRPPPRRGGVGRGIRR